MLIAGYRSSDGANDVDNVALCLSLSLSLFPIADRGL
jgi:hypothetical protein